MPKRVATEKTKQIQAGTYKPPPIGSKIRHKDPPKQKKPKFGELTHDVPAIAEESKKVKETEVFAK